MAKTLLAKGYPPVWTLEAAVICNRGKYREEDFMGNMLEMPSTFVSVGYLSVHANTLAEAQAGATRMINEVYDEDILRIDYINTHPESEIEHVTRKEGLPGLKQREYA